MSNPRDRQHRNDQRRSSGDSYYQEQTLQELWPGYLSEGFLDADGNLRIEYVERKRVAPLMEAMSRAKPKHLTMSQARRFFQHCRAIEARLRARTSTWQEEEANFRMLDVAAADAFGKSQRKIPQLFHDLIRSSVAAVKGEADFLKGFLPHFEALIGFGSQYLHERERN